MGKLDLGRVFLGFVILAVGGFLVLVNIKLTSFEIVGLWPLLLIVPGAVFLCLAVIMAPPQAPQSRPLRPLHGEAGMPPEMHQGPLIW